METGDLLVQHAKGNGLKEISFTMGFLILGAGGARAGSVPQNASDTQNSCHGAWRWAQCPLLDPFFGAPFMLLTKPAA